MACGTGNQSIPAARAGAKSSVSTSLPTFSNRPANAPPTENLKIEFIEGDAEKLPFEAARFDVVLSMFGAMFAPRPEVVASELLRVCRPGGLIAMGNWTPEGFVGQMFRITAQHSPPPPGIRLRLCWGVEKIVTERWVGGKGAPQDQQSRSCSSTILFRPAEAVAFFRKYFGPTQTTFARLDEAGQQRPGRRSHASTGPQNNLGDANHTVIKAEYLEVHATVV